MPKYGRVVQTAKLVILLYFKYKLNLTASGRAVSMPYTKYLHCRKFHFFIPVTLKVASTRN